MIVYADSSVLARAYLADEPYHDEARSLLEDPDVVLVTGSWTDIEVSGALVRAARSHRGDLPELLAAWDSHTDPEGGLITLLTAPQEKVEARALGIVRQHGLRAMDAWHVSIASLTVPELSDGEAYGFASRDKTQSEIASAYGFLTI
ncbi:PIN domain-containing protein [Sphaerisporangium album]|uniref:PIN domain-containing protein n=1 Tax=Sphaerisporangium album TaxID=509200 RepID=A0A367EZ57_9ACTN|nr:type II toxin-antitoxin system VapC family toxin [Sphaerisporangium album]RCG23414.1 PIN domain-containing protein [Sphaerisporangium album]